MRRSPFRRPEPAARFRAAKAAEVEVLIYEEIGAWWGISALEFCPMFAAIEADRIHVRINSPGGSVFEGITIANAIARHPTEVVTHIDGIAASIAGIIALAGDRLEIAPNAFLMIHEPWTFAMGTAADLRKDAETLDKIGGTMVADYVRNSDASEDEVRAWMKDETWFTAEEAIEAGFADGIDGEAEEQDAAAMFDLSVFQNIPSRLQEHGEESSDPTIRQVERALRDAGFGRRDAKRVAALARQDAARDAGSEAMRASLERLLEAIKTAS